MPFHANIHLLCDRINNIELLHLQLNLTASHSTHYRFNTTLQFLYHIHLILLINCISSTTIYPCLTSTPVARISTISFTAAANTFIPSTSTSTAPAITSQISFILYIILYHIHSTAIFIPSLTFIYKASICNFYFSSGHLQSTSTFSGSNSTHQKLKPQHQPWLDN